MKSKKTAQSDSPRAAPREAGGSLPEADITLETLLAASIDPMIITDAAGVTVRVNPAYAEMLGYAAHELIGTPANGYYVREGAYECTTGEMLFIDEAYHRTAIQAFHDLLACGKVSSLAAYYLRRDGRAIPTEQHISLLYNEAGEMTGSFSIIRDCTMQRCTELSLQESEERFRTLFEYAPEAYYLSDPLGTFIDGNRAAELMVGYRREELIGKNFFDLDILSADDLATALGLLERNSAGESTGPDEFVLHTKDGSSIHTEIRTYPVEIRGEKVVLGIAHDISIRKDRERILKESEKRFFDIVQGIPVPTFVIDHGHVITHWNSACEKLTGIAARKAVGTLSRSWPFAAARLPSPADLIVESAPGEDFRRHYGGSCRKSFFADGAYELEYHFGEAGNNDRWYFFTAAPVKDVQGSVVGAIQTIQDITQRKHMEEELLRARAGLEQKVKERTESLEEANTALRVLLKKRDEDKAALEDKVMHNVNNLIKPYLEKLQASGLAKNQRVYLDILTSNLQDIISPFLRGLSLKHLKLTPAELQVANLVARGKTTKEIACLLGSGLKTVEFHRDNIRKKAGLKKKGINLRTWLLSLS